MVKKIKLSKNLFQIHGKTIEGILRVAVRNALKEHKRAGNPIAVWRKGKVVIIPPEEIPVR
jgi:hypothetical protein